MTDIFLNVVKLSFRASVIIPFIVLVRFMIRKQPKIYAYALWAVVFAGLIADIQISLPHTDRFITPVGNINSNIDSRYTRVINDYIGDTQVYHDNTMEYYYAVESGIEPVFNRESGENYVITGENGIARPETVGSYVMPKLSVIWLAGVVVGVFVFMKNIVDFHGRLVFAHRQQDNIYFSDNITSPFVYGIIRPKIYIPSQLADMPLEHIISHEQTHIRRGDHIIKPLCLIIAVIHWFNPFVWLAFALMCKDMEMSCDEAVVNKTGGKKDYSLRLLNCAADKNSHPARAVLFGESDVENRIKNILSYHKPAKTVSLLLTAVVAICFTACVVEEKVEEIIPSPAPETFYQQLEKINGTQHIQYKNRELMEGKHFIITTDEYAPHSEMALKVKAPDDIDAFSLGNYGLAYNGLTGTFVRTQTDIKADFAYVKKGDNNLYLCSADQDSYDLKTLKTENNEQLLCVATGREVLGDNLEFLSFYTKDTNNDIWLNIHRIIDGKTEIYRHRMNEDNFFILRGLRFINENVGFMGQTDRGYIKEGSTASSYSKYDVPVANITIDGGKTWHKLDFSQLAYPKYFKGYSACCMVVLGDMIEIRYFVTPSDTVERTDNGDYPFSYTSESYSIISYDAGLTWAGYVRKGVRGSGTRQLEKVTETIPVQILN